MFEYDQRMVMQWNANGDVDDLNDCDEVFKKKRRKKEQIKKVWVPHQQPTKE